VSQHVLLSPAAKTLSLVKVMRMSHDEAAHWDKLAAYFPIKRINHQVAYSKDGACTKQAESFFSRLRRAKVGTHHHIAGKYLGA